MPRLAVVFRSLMLALLLAGSALAATDAPAARVDINQADAATLAAALMASGSRRRKPSSRTGKPMGRSSPPSNSRR